MNSQKTLWDLDIRVRDRNLQKGLLTPKDIERYLKELPDASANAEPVSLPQPVFENAGQEEGGEAARESQE